MSIGLERKLLHRLDDLRIGIEPGFQPHAQQRHFTAGATDFSLARA